MANAIITIEAPDRFIEIATDAAIKGAQRAVKNADFKEKQDMVKQALEQVFELAKELNVPIRLIGGGYYSVGCELKPENFRWW